VHTGERARCPLTKNPTPRFEFSDQRSHCSYFTKWLLYRTLTVVFHDFPGPFLCASSRTFQVHLYPFFMSFQERLIEITPATFEQHSTAYSKISCPTLTANRRESSQDAIESKSSNADNCLATTSVKYSRYWRRMYIKAKTHTWGKNAATIHFPWLSTTFQDLGMIPWLSRPGKFEF